MQIGANCALQVKRYQIQPANSAQKSIGQGVSYALSNWSQLVRYLEDGRLKPDNNAAENAIRSFLVGRKIGYFQGIPMERMHRLPFTVLLKPPKPVVWSRIDICASYLRDFLTLQAMPTITHYSRRQSNLHSEHNFFNPL